MYLDGEVVFDWLVEASWHAAVLCGVDEDSRSKDVVKQVAGQSVALLTLEVQCQLQNLDQVRPIGQDLVTVHTGHLYGIRQEGGDILFQYRDSGWEVLANIET